MKDEGGRMKDEKQKPDLELIVPSSSLEIGTLRSMNPVGNVVDSNRTDCWIGACSGDELESVSCPVLQSPRIVLEPLLPSHALDLFDGLCDRRLYEFIDDAPPENVDALRQRYEKLAPRKSPDGSEWWLNWAARLRDGAKYVGAVQATVIADGSAEIAFVLFRDAWGKGYAGEAAAAMIDHLRDQFRVNQLRARVDPGNHRSIAVLARLGFVHTKSRVGAEMIRGKLADVWDFEKLR